ncbi:uncharacterized protein K489DRAFT_142661 [Dissoconium aciculare CBS 342.82]|uniref:Zn(2)-C6 fungal-type domain-containing protein n=1 Tax=Dissoconium aciculare CBS 342.82 TaxID=1314786 RepID=A0A6J3M9W8_9PEZI|nr:uncharacterized protein K489DRAFT_142661 [Dissoconium aciculare CBS 342.82]KAF1824831.1 hypothetical protein K489DRAFT_142661 [Dissoconium aciculare CBS 342.82]
MTSPRNQHQQTIRQSCNSCAQQKVRCSKERPSCTRCKNKGLECEYAYSRRTGRRSAASLSARSSISGPIAGVPQPLLDVASVSSTGMLEDSSTLFSDCNFAPGSLDDLDYPIAPTMIPFEFSWTPPPPLTMSNGSRNSDSVSSSNSLSPTVSSVGASGSVPYHVQPNIHLLNINDNLTNDHEIGMIPGYWPDQWQEMQPAMNNVISTAQISPADLAFATSNTGALPKQSRNSLALSLAQTSLASPTQTSLPDTTSNTTEDHQGEGDNCMSRALELIASLHRPAKNPCINGNIFTSIVSNTSNSESNTEPTIDQILITNRAAIASLLRILNCVTCLAQEDRGVTLACFLIAGKIVTWYATALTIGAATTAPADDLTTTSNGIRPSDTTLPTSIFLGDYLLDSATSRSVRAGLILAELAEHMQPLLTRLVERLPGIPNVIGAVGNETTIVDGAAATVVAGGSGNGNSIDGGGKGCYELNCALRERVRGLVNEARVISLGC